MAKIGTWNLENLFGVGGGAGAPTTQQDYDAKLDSLATTLTDLAPDAMAVQEIGDPEALDDLVGRLDGTWHTETGAPDSRGIRVGLIAKVPLANVEQFTEYPEGLGSVRVDDEGETLTAMGRSALHARVELDGVAIDLVAVHLKSKLLSYPGGRFNPRDEGERARYAVYALHRRAAEAATVRAGIDTILDGQGTTRRLLVAGDMNDEPEAATTQIMLGPGGSEFETAGFDRPDQGDAVRMWNLAPLLPQDHRFSRVYRGRGELIDHILVSNALTGAVAGATTGTDPMPSVTDDPDARQDKPGSDHRPVIATFDLGQP